ncbi:hypothetical protein [Azotobacter armeniacus]
MTSREVERTVRADLIVSFRHQNAWLRAKYQDGVPEDQLQSLIGNSSGRPLSAPACEPFNARNLSCKR